MVPESRGEGEAFETQSYLREIRNIRPGLRARSKIIRALRARGLKALEVASMAQISYTAALNHLKSMKRENVACRTQKRPYIWALTDRGQKSVLEFAEKE